MLMWPKLLVLALILGNGTAYKKMLSKEKAKLAAWRSGLKQDKFDLLGESKVGVEKKEERRQVNQHADSFKEKLCTSYDKDALPSFFLKLGVMTSLIRDAAQASRTIEALALSRTEDKWLRMKMEDNKSHSKKSKLQQSAQAGKVPMCHGVDYLSALDAMSAPSSGSRSSVDVSVLVGSLADMSDKPLSMLLANIFTLCDTATKQGCPIDSDDDSETCVNDNCISGEDCAFGELCCPTHCGSYVCVMGDKRRKSHGQRQSHMEAKCKDADAFMQCVYNNIGAKLCG